MNRKLKPQFTLAAALTALLVSAPALADHDRGRWQDDDDNDRVQYAKVVSSTPIYRQVRVSEPRQECHEQRVVYRDRGYRDSDALVGALIGGVVGHQFGSGRGNAAATAAGALIGASVATDGRRHSRERVSYEPVCETVHETRYEERIEGYDVSYKLNGRLYHTRLPYDPGRRLAVNVDVRPLRSY